MKVSVIVSVYNGADILPITFPPLFNQDYPKDKTEIIFVNDGSTDDSSKVLKSFEQKAYIKVISHSENMGRSTTRNSGIKTALGELLIFLDCDIEVELDFISRHVKYHKHKHIIGVLSHIRTRDLNSKDKYHRYIFAGKRGASTIGKDKPLPFNYFIIGCTSVKLSAVRKVGGFNVNLPVYGEDLDFAYRLWKSFPKELFYSEEIIVYMHKVKTLEDALFNYSQYGQYNVPIIIKQFPNLAPYVAADFVKSIDGKFSWKVLFGLFIINSFIFQLVKCLLLVAPFPLSNLLIRYLLAASVAMGYRRHLKCINNN